ncbi:hypothetical protein ACHAWF_014206 [Thalassiosira exigua]
MVFGRGRTDDPPTTARRRALRGGDVEDAEDALSMSMPEPAPVPTVMSMSMSMDFDAGSSSSSSSQLVDLALRDDAHPTPPLAPHYVVVGHDPDTGEAIYEDTRCASNDHERPYDWNCTEAPSRAPSEMPSSAPSGTPSSAPSAEPPSRSLDVAGRGSGEVAYECDSSGGCGERPGGGEGGPWSLLGPCPPSPSSCPDAHDGSRRYEIGARVSVSVDRWAFTCAGTDCNDVSPDVEVVEPYREDAGSSAGDSESDSEVVPEGGWRFSGGCLPGVPEGSADCPDALDEDRWYARGDVVSVEVETATSDAPSGAAIRPVYECAVPARCNRFPPDDASGKKGWRASGSCEEGTDCPDRYDDDEEYEKGDRVYIEASDEADGSGSASAYDERAHVVYGCVAVEECNASPPGDGDAEGGWAVAGTCLEDCPDEYSASKASQGVDGGYVQGDTVVVAEERQHATHRLYECVHASDCGAYPPGHPSRLGWKVAGTCREGEDCPDAYDESKWGYEVGDRVIASDGGGSDSSVTVVDATLSDGASSDVAEANATAPDSASVNDTASVISNITAANATGSNATGTDTSISDGGYTEHYAYACASVDECNSTPPGDRSGRGWTFLRVCREDADCPGAYDEAKAADGGYVEGDEAMVTSDDLNEKVEETSASCPDLEEDEGEEVPVAYVYEVEAINVTYAEAFLPRLEERMLLAFNGTMSCEGGEEFAVGGIHSAPDDVAVKDGPCTMSMPNAQNCFLIGGNLTLKLYNSTNSTEATLLAIEAARSVLGDAMADDTLLSPNLPEVLKVRYLADDLDNYLAGFVAVAAPIIVGDGKTSDGGGGAGAAFLGAVIGGVVAALLIMCCVCLLVRHRLRHPSKFDEAAANARRNGGAGSRDGIGGDSQGVTGGDYDWDEWEDGTEEGAEEDRRGAVISPVVGGWMGDDAGGGGEVVLRVDGLGRGATEADVRELFEQYGTVTNCIVSRDRSHRKGRGSDPSLAANNTRDEDRQFALLTMPASNHNELAEAESAVKNLDGQEMLDGRILDVGEVTTLYVGNLPPHMYEDDVRNLFGEYGRVVGCLVPTDNETDNEKISDSDKPSCRMQGCALPAGFSPLCGVGVGEGGGSENGSSVDNDIGGSSLCESRGREVSNKTKRFALVTMPVDDAVAAIKGLHRREVDGHKLRVKDMKYMNGGQGIPGGGLAAAAMAAGIASFKGQKLDDGLTTLRVGNLSPDTTETKVREVFEEHGTVKECVIPSDQEIRVSDEEGGSSGGIYALVTMPADEAEAAIDVLDGAILDGNALTVQDIGHAGHGIRRKGSPTGRNLMDDSTTFDARAQPPGLRASTAAMVGFMAGVPLLLAAPILKRRQKEESERDGGGGSSYRSSSGRSHRASTGDADHQSLDEGLDNIIEAIDGTAEGGKKDDPPGSRREKTLVLDPPGAFHLGNHHYTGDGKRYFSPLCEQCVAARATADASVSALEPPVVEVRDESNEKRGDGENGETASIEGEVDELSYDLEQARKFTDFNANDLGRTHSSMHVRHCKSTTCAICQQAKGVYFVKSRGCTPINPIT